MPPTKQPTTRNPTKSPIIQPTVSPTTSRPSRTPSRIPSSAPTMCDANGPQNTSTLLPCEVAPRCANGGCGCAAGGVCVVQSFLQCQLNAINRTYCCNTGDTYCAQTLQDAGLPYSPDCPTGTICTQDCCSEVGALSCSPICFS